MLRVRFLFVALLTLGLVGAAGPEASADTYVSLGVGAPARVDGSLESRVVDDRSEIGSARLALGTRVGPVAVEARLFGSDLSADGLNLASASAGLGAKYFVPLGGGFEIYGGAGISRTWLVTEDSGDPMHGSSGVGIDYGGGLQFRFAPLPIGSAAIWLDFTRQELDVSSSADMPDIDGQLDMVMIGLSIGL